MFGKPMGISLCSWTLKRMCHLPEGTDGVWLVASEESHPESVTVEAIRIHPHSWHRTLADVDLDGFRDQRLNVRRYFVFSPVARWLQRQLDAGRPHIRVEVKA